MSASLVGSEMCIRDSSTLQALCVPIVVMLVGAAFIISLAFAVRLGGGWAVSYTHLTLPTICSV
eukprot:343107-Alexandrium_andersonii.AAC.1